MNIDLHNHVVPPAVVDALTRNPARYGTGIEEHGGKRYFNVHGRYAELQAAFYDVDGKSNGWTAAASTLQAFPSDRRSISTT